MTDFATMMWKELAEFLGNRRSMWIFTFMVLFMGILPVLTFANHHANGNSQVLMIVRVLYVLFATAVVVANTAPDIVLHERVGHTLDYLLTTRLPDRAIFGAKVLFSAAMGYIAALLALAIQLVASGLFGGTGWHWLFLGVPSDRVVALGFPAVLSLYVAVVGTFVALRIGAQQAAYLVTMLSVGLLIVPFLVGWLHISLTTQWMLHVLLVYGAIAVALGLIGLRLFRRHMLVFYLQD